MKIIKCLFWNIYKKPTPFESIIKDVSTGIDILILAEADSVDDAIITAKTGLKRILSVTASDHDTLTPKFFSSENGFTLTHLNTVISKRLIMNILKVDGLEEIIFGGIHLPSKLRYNPATQESIASSYVNWILEVERICENKRTIIAGDFNMNPYELGMINPKTFNATLSKEIAKNNITRTFHHEQYDYFYNPMWSFIGDHDCSTGVSKLPGSYFHYTTTDVLAPYWNVFDKVILRPCIVDHLDMSSISIPHSLNGHNFANHLFEIDKITYSDHLPLLFNLKY